MGPTHKMFPPIKVELSKALIYLLENKSAASKVVQYVFKNNKKWGSRDRKVFAEAFFDVVRNLAFFGEKVNLDIIHYTKEFDLDKIDALFSVYEKGVDDQELSLFDLKRTVHKDFLEQLEKNFKTPSDISNYLSESLKIAPVFLRANSVKVTDEELLDELSREGVKASVIKPGCLKLEERQNVFNLKSFKLGFFEIQDGASQDVAPFLNPELKSRVADSCAGAGGKTLHIAALMKNTGSVVAMDIFPRRLEELKKRVKRSGLQNISTKPIETTKAIKRLKSTMDKVLLDVPCTGAGTFRRKPEGKFFFRTSGLKELIETQKSILDLHSQMLKKGGELVYATCSILDSENSDQVKSFLKRHSNFTFVEERLNPMGKDEFDGFYMAKLIKKEE